MYFLFVFVLLFKKRRYEHLFILTHTQYAFFPPLSLSYFRMLAVILFQIF